MPMATALESLKASADIVDEEERHGDREQAQKDEQEDAEGGQIVFPAEPGLEALGRQAAEMEPDALEVRRRQSRQDGGREIVRDDRPVRQQGFRLRGSPGRWRWPAGARRARPSDTSRHR